MNHGRCLLVCFSLAIVILLPGCRIVQSAPENGWIVSRTGLHDCAAGETCTISVEDGAVFSDTFTAVPAAGFVFTGWVHAKGYVCGGSVEPCVLENISAEFTALDIDVLLEPVFAAPPSPQGTFRDCDDCPLLMVVPPGEFTMGSEGAGAAETPLRKVSVESFAIGVFEVTADEWVACYLAQACSTRGGGAGLKPINRVSWHDAHRYLAWLSERTGATYRLPTEAEWEYAARGGTDGNYFWGENIGENRANCNEACGDSYAFAGPVGEYEANAFGLYDMHGNLYEWVEECLIQNYLDAPTDGSAAPGGDCDNRRLRGGSWSDAPDKLRSAFRGYGTASGRFGDSGFRVVRVL